MIFRSIRFYFFDLVII